MGFIVYLHPLSATGRSESRVKPIGGSAVCQFRCESLLHSREKGGAAGSSSLLLSSCFPCLNCSRTCGSPPDVQLSPPLAGQGREQKQEAPLCVDRSDRGGTADPAAPAPRNPVYTGNTDGLRLNRHFYLQEGEIQKFISTTLVIPPPAPPIKKQYT